MFVFLQVNDKVPTVSIDKTDGCQVFFPSGIGSTEIVTAKSSEMNIMLPKDGGQDMVSTNVTPHCQQEIILFCYYPMLVMINCLLSKL